MKKFVVLLAALVSFAATTGAEARHRHHVSHRHHVARAVHYDVHPDCNRLFPCQDVVASPRGEKIARELGFGSAVQHYTPHVYKHVSNYGAPTPNVRYTAAQIVGGRPAGCPHAFCGCGTSLHVFGRIIPRLNLAANWSEFPRAMAAAGMVAYRRGHVFAIESVLGNGMVMAYDSNSGGHATRIHARSLAGYTVVNPHGGSRYASAI